MFDTTSLLTYKNIPLYYEMIVSDKERPMVLAGNKVDLKERMVKPKQITFHRKKKLLYFDISVKANYNILRPILSLLKQHLQFTTLEHVSGLDYRASAIVMEDVLVELHFATKLIFLSRTNPLTHISRKQWRYKQMKPDLLQVHSRALLFLWSDIQTRKWDRSNPP